MGGYVFQRWIADALRAEGCKVKEYPGWQNRGRPASSGGYDPQGPQLHHTGSTTSYGNPAPTLNMCVTGRPDLPGPLCAVVIGYDGVCHVIAAGRANHAGTSNGFGPYKAGDGNSQCVGFELDYNGTQAPSPEQKDAAVRAAAAICRHFKHREAWTVIHAETSITGKWDTGQVSGRQWRSLVGDRLTKKPDQEEDDMPYSEWPDKDKKALADDVVDALLARDLYEQDKDKKVTVGKALRQSEKAAKETLEGGMKLPSRTPREIVSFNGKIGRGGKAMCHSIRGILEDNPDTDVLLLQESGGYVDDLRNTFWRGWKVYAKKGWDESDNCPVMVRRFGFAPRLRYGRGWGTLRCHEDWIGPHGQHHPGRTWTWVKVGGIYVLSLHRVWGGERDFHGNGKAYAEEASKLTDWILRHQPCVVFGDTNCGFHETHPASMRDIREDVKGKLAADMAEPGIDYALTKRVQAVVNRTRPYGSDHRAAVMSAIEPR